MRVTLQNLVNGVASLVEAGDQGYGDARASNDGASTAFPGIGRDIRVRGACLHLLMRL